MSDEENGTERVTQLWPADLKKLVQAKVGARGVTRFTLEAVREKIAREEAAETVKQAIGETPETPVAVVEREQPVLTAPTEKPEQVIPLEPVVHDSKLIEGETRGADVAVQTVSTGASELYSSSQARVQAMLDKAAGLGLKKAVDLPVPPKPVVEEIAAPDQVIEETDEEPFDPNAYDEPTPPDQLTLQEQLAQINTVPANVLPDAEPVSTPVQTRSLDDIDVDF